MKKLLEIINLSKKDLTVAILLCFIFVLAIVLRTYNLNSVPLGFHIDEASLGYNGYSLLLTGKDENNNKNPLYIDMFGDNRPSGYHYLTELPIKFLGLNELATRLPGAIFGSFTIIPFFFLAQILFGNRKVSLISSFLLSIAPWHVVLSRASAETVVALFFIISGYMLLLTGFKKQKKIYFFLGAFVLLLSFFFYHTPRVFIPLLFLVSVLYLYPIWKKFTNKHKAYLLSSFIILSIVSFSLVFIIKGGTGRFSQVNIFGYPQIRLLQEEQIKEDGLFQTPVILTRFFHNKPLNYSLGFIENYFAYFSGKFLFIEGGLPIWYKVPSMGLIYIVESPFIIVGIFYLLSSKNRYHKLPLIWLMLSPLAASVTRDDVPNIQRAIVMFPMIELIAAYGFITILNKFKKFQYRIVAGIFVIILAWNLSYFMHQYFVQAQVHRNWYRNEGFGEMLSAVKKDYTNYDKIIVTKAEGGIYPLILFYMNYDPRVYLKEGSPKDKAFTGFGKFFFALVPCPSKDRDNKFPKVNKTIFIDNGTCPDYKGLESHRHLYITRKDGTRVFRIVYD